MSSVETGQMSVVETGQMSVAESGQMSAAETGQMSAVETRQMLSAASQQTSVMCQNTMCRSQKSQVPQCHNVQVSDMSIVPTP